MVADRPSVSPRLWRERSRLNRKIPWMLRRCLDNWCHAAVATRSSLRKPKLLVGRRASCDIVLEYPNVSSQHCELELLNGYWQVRDLNSANGVKINGQRVDCQFLHPGDELTIAKCRYKIEYEASNEPPPRVQEEMNENPFAMSLLEKAGLERRKGARPQRQLPPPLPVGEGPAAEGELPRRTRTRAMKWLMGDD